MQGAELSARIEHLLMIEKLFISFFDFNPIASWHKLFSPVNQSFFMDKVNDAYTAQTGITASAYSGQADDRLWEKDNAQEFYHNDLRVVQHRITLPIAEHGINPRDGTPQVFVGFKWPHIENDIVIGVWGMANFFSVDEWEKVKPNHPFYKRFKVIIDAADAANGREVYNGE